MISHRKALLALLLLAPAPTLGTLAGMVLWPDSTLGMGLFAASKLWLLALPLAWQLGVDREPLGGSPPRQGGFGVGLLSGLLLSLVILAGYLLAGDALIDKAALARKAQAIGLGSAGAYIGGAAYWILVNSVLEEYVWRWFCFKQTARLLPPLAAVIVSALLFTLHHVVALATFLSAPATALCSLGVLTGGALWSLMYLKYRSIWPGYLSHALVDLCVFGIGAMVVFGRH